MQDTTFQLLIFITLLVLALSILYFKLVQLSRRIDILGGIVFGILDAMNDTQESIKRLTSIMADILSDIEDVDNSKPVNLD